MRISLHAQTATAALHGSVVDPGGGVTPGATVTLTNVGTNQRRVATTGEDGQFGFEQLPPAQYVVDASLDGFSPAERATVTLNVGDERVIRLTLRLGAIEDSIEVRGESSSIQRSPAVGTVISREFIANMPLSGRTLQSLFDLTPGVTRTAPGSGGQFVVNGQRSDANYYLVDGVGANVGVSPFAATSGIAGTLPSLSVLNTTNTLVPVEALQEFKILTSSYAPEFGRSPGGQVSLVTRSGTNRWTGSAFEYFRDASMDARDWFARRDNLAKPPMRQHDFGGVLGGPVVLPGYDGHNRTFFFASYESLRLKQPQTVTEVVPSLAARAAATGVMRTIIDVYPLPTGSDILDASGRPTGAANYSASYADPSQSDTYGLRIDQVLGHSGTLFGRYSAAPSDSSLRSQGMASLRITDRNTRTLTVGHTWTPAARASNDLRANVTVVDARTNNDLDTFGGAVPPPDSLLFPSFATRETASMTFQMDFGSLFPSFVVGDTARNQTRQFNVVESFILTAGAHTFKMGGDYRRFDLDLVANTSFSPNFPTLAQFYTGVVPSLSITARQRGLEPVLHNLSLFVQDTWRTADRLTLTYGVRWDLNPAPSDRNGNDLTTLVGTEAPETFAMASDVPLFPTRYDNFAPRLGATYALGQRDGWESVLKGGAGVFYDLGTTFALLGYEGYPHRITVNYPNVTFPPATAPGVVEPVLRTMPPYSTAYGYVSDFVSPRTWQWNATFEQSLGSRQRISIGYVGAAGRELTRTEAYTRPNPLFSDTVQVVRNAAVSDYRSLQVQYVQRLWRGLEGMAAYTWAHATDTASSGGSGTINVPVTFANVDESRADSDFDVRHTFAASLSYQLPSPARGAARAILGGFSVDMLVKARSASPVNLTGRALGAPYNSALRPDVAPGVPLYLDDPVAPGGRRFNPAAFTLNAVGTQGTLPRNALRGFGASQVDLALRRDVRLHGRARLQLRAELFNVFDQANFGNPVASITSPLFGRSTAVLNRSLSGLSPLYETGGPRSTQLAIKLLF